MSSTTSRRKGKRVLQEQHPPAELCEYEQQRKQRIKQNRQVMAELQVLEAAAALKPAKQKTQQRKPQVCPVPSCVADAKIRVQKSCTKHKPNHGI
jgi:hypothetical protein